MIKRVKPYWKEETLYWLDNLGKYLDKYNFWHDGIIEELENKIKSIVKRKHALAVNSCSNAIFMALKVWSEKYPSHKDVLIPNWGYPAALKTSKFLKLNSIPIDIDKWTLGMTPQNIIDYMGNKTLACIHIENNGMVGDPGSIRNVLYDDVLFIEDCAPSLLQDKAGSFGDISMFSFSPTKPLMGRGRWYNVDG
jgi:dTDP-4-amino-4,6-dideoxygalactose transaminase